MTRTPRSRKKKSAATAAPDAAAFAAPVEVTESLGLPLPAPEAVDEAVTASATPAAADVADTAAADANEAAAVADAPSLPEPVRSTMTIDVTDDRSHLGPRLRAAREVRGWSREDVAHRLHVPTTVIADIEAERFERLGAPIYIRGYLSKYVQLVELPLVVVNRVIEGMSEPLLKASTDTPRPAAGWERYRVAVIGGVITLAVAIPVLTLVANRGIHAPVPQVRSLDESEMVQPVASAPADNGSAIADTPANPEVVAGSGFESTTVVPPASPDSAMGTTPQVADPAVRNPPVMASMAGFSAPSTMGGHVLEASFREDSWIEIFDAEGRVIEQNLVRAGQSRRYESTGAVSIKIGNVGGVDVRADGNPIDLAPHARANVARLRLFEAATPTP